MLRGRCREQDEVGAKSRMCQEQDVPAKWVHEPGRNNLLSAPTRGDILVSALPSSCSRHPL
eukprot:3506847-Amphidinium_carterae.1